MNDESQFGGGAPPGGPSPRPPPSKGAPKVKTDLQKLTGVSLYD